jgi:lysozyme
MPNVLVVDIYHLTPAVDFKAIKSSGVVGVIHKSSQGTSFVDAAYSERRAAARSAGLLWGAYHFGTAADPNAQVSNFLSAASPDAQTLIALDVELNEQSHDNSMSLDQAKQFLQIVESRLGRKAVIYGGQYLASSLTGVNDDFIDQHRLWWAQYHSAPDRIPQTWGTYFLWQYTDGHHGPAPYSVPGIDPCDCNTFDGTADELSAVWV